MKPEDWAELGRAMDLMKIAAMETSSAFVVAFQQPEQIASVREAVKERYGL